MVRIVHVIYSLERGGAEEILYRLTTFRPSSPEIEHLVICFGAVAPYGPLLEEKGVKLLAAPNNALQLGAWLKDSFKTIKKFSPHAIQGWMYRGNVLATILGKILKVPSIWGIHCSNFNALTWKSRTLVGLTVRLSSLGPSRIISCAKASSKIHVAAGYPEDKMVTIHNGYNCELYSPAPDRRERIRKALNISASTVLLGTIARNHPQKDIPNLIKALSCVNVELANCDWTSLIAGTGLEESNAVLLSLIESKGLIEKVRLLGPRSDVPDLMKAFDLFILPSAFGEAFPNVVAEAMASGTPCIVTDVGDSSMMLGQTGWTVPPSDPEALGRAVVNAINERKNEPVKWNSRLDAARQHILANYTLEGMHAGYLATWQEVSKGTTFRAGSRAD